ncbi:hypothetical protein L596_027259 [Steinernema carpocapsae]|uniref:Uncharacterized protein n=1 Tax=Steinernema carpocapsae TaxID=34508 RepID=A0A4U5M3S1_STECR|nr:hypothetical protein L596_027259 [Steinernema carpocapsae]
MSGNFLTDERTSAFGNRLRTGTDSGNPTQFCSSDRKKLLARVGEDVAAAIGKMQMAIVAITNFSNVKMNLYVFDSTPLLFEIAGEGTLYPTGTFFGFTRFKNCGFVATLVVRGWMSLECL